MIVGYVSAYTSPAAETMKEELSLTEDKVIDRTSSALFGIPADVLSPFLSVFMGERPDASLGAVRRSGRRFPHRDHRPQMDDPSDRSAVPGRLVADQRRSKRLAHVRRPFPGRIQRGHRLAGPARLPRRDDPA